MSVKLSNLGTAALYAGRALAAIPRHYRPLFDVFVGYACGTWLALNVSLAWPAAAAFGLLSMLTWVAAWSLYRRAHLLVRVPAILSVAALGCAVGLLHPAVGRQGVPEAWLSMTGERVELRGRVNGDPVCRRLDQRERCVWTFPLRLSAVHQGTNSWQAVAGDLLVNWYGWADSNGPVYGDAWEVRGTVRTGHGRGGARFVNVDGRDTVLLGEGGGNRLLALCYRVRGQAAGVLSIGLENRPQQRALLLALLLGYRDQLDPELHDLFALTGTLHIFAISGLHVGILAGILIQLLRVCRVPRGGWIFFLAPCLAMYALSTGARASAVRACIMAVTYFLAPALGRKADVPSGLALAALLILVWNPGQLQDIGFIFSFTVVTGLVAFYPPFLRLSEYIWQKDPFLMGQGTVLQRSRRATLRYLLSLAALSLAAWLSSAPLTACFFGRFTPVALLGNIVVIPLAFLCVLCGCLALVLGSCLGSLAILFNQVNAVLIDGLIGTMQAMSVIPYGSVRIEKMPLRFVWLSYTLLACLALWLHHLTRHVHPEPAPPTPSG